MINKLIEYLKGKKILILGFGVEGQSTYKIIRKYLKEQFIYVADEQENFNEKYEMLVDDVNAQFISGESYLDNLDNYDLIIKSPGISLKNINIISFKEKITSQLELFLEFFNVYTIGITGTKGKSTTSSLIYEVLKQQEKHTLLLGNIGIPIFDYIDVVEKDMIVILELSSHQLEYVKRSPNISILLNLYEEHLDHYKSMNEYIEAKANIFKYKNEDDYLIYNVDNEEVKNIVEKYKVQIGNNIYKISYQDKEIEENKYIVKDDYIVNSTGKQLYNINDERKLLGEHNLNNVMFVFAVSEILKIDLNKTIRTINTFNPLPHRMELVGTYDGITYYNDSIATVPAAAINSIKSFANVNTLIVGGMDRGINYDEFIEFLNKSNIKNLICLPTTGHYIGNNISNKKINVYKINTMEEAVKIAKEVTEKETICLLSPAASSYGFFKNFKERGEKYKRLVKEK